MRSAIKSIAKHVPEAPQNPVRGVPKFFKIEAWDGPGRQNAAPNLPRAAKRRPRAPKKCSRDAQEAPKRGQEPSQSEQKPAKWRFRVGQTLPESTPRCVLSTIFAGSYGRQPPATRSRRFVAGAQSVQYVKTIQKPRKNCGFNTCAMFSHCKPARATKHRKIRFWTLKNCL